MAKPVVDGIEREVSVPVLRLNTGGGVARTLAQGYGLRGVPTLLVLDGQGREVLRLLGRVDRQAVVAALDDLQ